VSERPGVGRLGAVGEEGLERPRGTDVCVCVSDREGGGGYGEGCGSGRLTRDAKEGVGTG
jgi:hypothetical protein